VLKYKGKSIKLPTQKWKSYTISGTRFTGTH
jgi:hypothetical protein